MTYLVAWFVASAIMTFVVWPWVARRVRLRSWYAEVDAGIAAEQQRRAALAPSVMPRRQRGAL